VNDLDANVTITVRSDRGYEGTCPAGDATPAESSADAGTDAGNQESDDESSGGAPAAGGGNYQMMVVCDPLPPPDALGANVRVSMTVHRSDGPVLVVPTTAITTRSSGDSFVEVVERDGTRRVSVTVGGEADGYAAVQPVGGSLDEGMDVRVRRR
jgi:hypothetical protein